MKTINTKGKAWPEPMAIIKSELNRGETELEVLSDDPFSASNVMNFLENQGFSVQLKDDEGSITISARKGGQPVRTAAFKKQPEAPVSEAKAVPKAAAPPGDLIPEPSRTLSILVTCLALGHDQKLGETLIKSFLGALSNMGRAPVVVALMNDGVKLALYDSSSCDHLKNLEKKGALVLICGTCANYFNIMDKIGAGTISSMVEIIDALNKADKIMTL